MKTKRYRFGGEDREQLPSGDKRIARLAAEEAARQRIPARFAAARDAALRRRRSPVGLKRWFIPGSEFEGMGVLTLYASKVLARRRAASKVSKMARKVNR